MRAGFEKGSRAMGGSGRDPGTGGAHARSPSHTGVSMRLLGPPELAGAETVRFVAERRFQLLALLALRSGQWVPRDQIAALLWPDHDDAQARRNLRHVVFKARAVPGVEGIEADATALRWGVETDLQRFEALLREARALEAH